MQHDKRVPACCTLPCDGQSYLQILQRNNKIKHADVKIVQAMCLRLHSARNAQ